MEREELIDRLKKIGVVQKGSFYLKSGEKIDTYYDFRSAYGYPEITSAICNMLWHKMQIKPTCVASQGYGGIPLGAAISVLYGVHHSIIRTKLKEHGVRTYINGYHPKRDDEVVILDDVFTTGGSLIDIMNVLMPTNSVILGSYVILKRSEGYYPKYDLNYLFTPEDFA